MEISKSYSAKWIIAADGNLYEDCTMIVDEGKVQEIVKTSEFDLSKVKHNKDFGNSIITPGFINLHNHLQYTEVGKIKSKGFKYALKKMFMNFKKHYFVAGIKKDTFIYRLADLLSEYFCLGREEKIRSFKKGLELSLLSGTTCVAQLSKESKTYLFFELFSDSPDSSKEEFRNIQKKIDKLLKQKSENTFVGVAPHSVCSVHKRLFKTLVKYCKKNNILMTVRLAESKDEMDWLKFGFSDVDILNSFTGNKKFEPNIQGVSPVVYLDELGAINKRLLATYGNYLTKEDLEILKEHSSSFVYCPRVSDNLHGRKLDLETVLKYFPKKFGFGTNSLAFNKDLSLLKEIKYVNNGELTALEAIQYLTKYPAKILRLDNIIGTLEEGKDADFNVFKLNDGEDYNAILNKERPDYVYIKGHKMVSKGELVKKYAG